MKKMTLEEWAAPVLHSWPREDRIADAIRLSMETLPCPSDCVSDKIIILRSEHWMPASRHDRVEILADKSSLGSLGLFLFATIFHEGADDLEIGLRHPASQVRTMRVAREPLRAVEDSSGRSLAVRPLWYDYVWAGEDEELSRHPLLGQRDLEVCLTNQEDRVVRGDQRATRDVLTVAGGLSGAVAFAELLLDLGRPWVARTMVDLEARPGFESLSPSSAWIRIRLPGDPEWPDTFEPSASGTVL